MTIALTPSDTLTEGYVVAPEPDMADRVVPCRIGGRLYGVPLEIAGDMVVLTATSMTPIAFAPDVVRGVVNQHGRMATVIDCRRALGLPPATANSLVGLTVEQGGHFYVLTVDEVGELAAIRDAREPIAPLDIGAIVAAC